MKTYSTRTNAIRAARKELSGDAIAGLDFTVIEQPAGRWGYEPRNAAAGATPALQSAAPTNGDATEGAHEAPAGEPASQDAPASKSAPTERPKRTRRKPAAAKADKPPRENKGEAMLAMLWRPEGATVAEIAEAFGWLPHTTRAAISTKVRKAGLSITSEKVQEGGLGLSRGLNPGICERRRTTLWRRFRLDSSPMPTSISDWLRGGLAFGVAVRVSQADTRRSKQSD